MEELRIFLTERGLHDVFPKIVEQNVSVMLLSLNCVCSGCVCSVILSEWFTEECTESERFIIKSTRQNYNMSTRNLR